MVIIVQKQPINRICAAVYSRLIATHCSLYGATLVNIRKYAFLYYIIGCVLRSRFEALSLVTKAEQHDIICMNFNECLLLNNKAGWFN